MTTKDFKRKLAAILSADVKGYSRLMGEDEDHTIKTISAYREKISVLISKHQGRVVDSPGDNILAEFTSALDAVNTAVEIQETLKVKNDELPDNRKMEFRIGINLGDIIQEGDRIYGDGVNVAARIEGLADPGGVCISRNVCDQVKKKLTKLGYEYIGAHDVKNISEPIRVYKVLVEPEYAGKVIGEIKDEPKRGQRIALAAVIVLILIVGGVLIWRAAHLPVEIASIERMAFPLPDKPSIAVLPFVNMSGDPEQEYFSDGLTDQIITGLSKVSDLFVIARNSTFTYKGKPLKVQKVAEDLGVKYVLEGSVQKTTDRIRIIAQLIDAIKGHHLWSERYDRPLKDIFAIQDDITKSITAALQVELTEGEQARLMAKGTNNLDAYLKYSEGHEHLYRFNKDDNLVARQKAEEALALDPSYSYAYALLSKTHLFDVWFNWSNSPKESLSHAFKLAKKALSLDEYSFEAYRVLSFIYLTQRQHDKAIEASEKAVSLAPSAADALFTQGLVLRFSGRVNEAISIHEKAIRLNPIPPASYLNQLGLCYAFIGEYEKAISTCKEALHKNPDDLVGRIALAIAYSSLGREEEADAEAAQVLRISPKFTVAYAEKTWPYKNQADKDLVISALRKAGLPDTPPLPLPDKPSIAVLAFDNMSGDPEQEFFCDGMSEEIITALSKIPKLFVIARNSTFTYKGQPVKVQQVSKELGVQYVVEGSVREAKDRVRITVQLIDALTGRHIWADKFDRDIRNIFSVQDEITKKVITALQVNLTDGEQAAIYSRGTNNLEAYLKIMKADWLDSQIAKTGVLKARQLANEAIVLDPDYAAAYRVLGSTHGLAIQIGFSKNPRESLKRAIGLFQKAIELDDSLAIAHVALGFWSMYARQYDKAYAEGKRGFELEPNSADVIMGYASILTMCGKPEKAIPLFKEALRLNPKSPSSYLHLFGIALRDSGHYEEAIIQSRKAIEKEPNNLIANVVLTSSLSLAGQEEEARIAAKEILRLSPNFSVVQWQQRSPHKDRSVAKRYCDALRKAGLPE